MPLDRRGSAAALGAFAPTPILLYRGVARGSPRSIREGGTPLDLVRDARWLWAGIDPALAPVAPPIGVALAAAVTVHVLLHKREVAAATAWIGLAWIAPVTGALLYFLFGINRVMRRAKRIRRPRTPRRRADDDPVQEIADHLVPLERAARRITQRMAERRNGVEIFHDGDQAYPRMLEVIGAARTSVALSSYIMRDDGIGGRFVEALAAAKERGAEVRVLVDGIGSGYFPPIRGRLRRAGVPTALFMHSAMPWRMPFLNLRSHKKLLVVDGAIAFTGGLNISDANLLDQSPRHPVSDTHFCFRGPVVTQLMDAFAHDWRFTTREDIEGAIWFPDPDDRDEGEVLARVVTSGPDQDLDKIRSVMLEACACARHSVKVMTPYFLPGDELVSALTLAALRGVKVDVIVPSKSDHRFLDRATRAHIRPLLEQGVRFWSGPPPFNHSKLMVVDRLWSLVGSSNWDTRSLRLNFELNVEVYDASVAQRLDAFMRRHQQTRLRLRDIDARSLPVKLGDAALRLALPYV